MKKGTIIFIVILILYLGIMYIFIGKNNMEEKNANEILLIHYDTKFKYNNYKWTKIEDSDYLEYNSKKYNVYQNQSFFGNYELMFNKKWYLFDEQNNSISFDYELFAHHGNKKLEFIKYGVVSIDTTDTENINKAIKEVGLKGSYSFIEGEKIIINYDSDYRDEQVYIIKNETGDKVFTITFLVDGNDIMIIDKDILDKEDSLLLKIYKFHSIIDIGLDENYEIIISQDTFGEHIPYCHYMLYKGREVDVVTSCEAR